MQDRQSCIVGRHRAAHRHDPGATCTVGGPGRPERAFDAEVVRHRFLTPMLAATVVANAAPGRRLRRRRRDHHRRAPSLGVRGLPAARARRPRLLRPTGCRRRRSRRLDRASRRSARSCSTRSRPANLERDRRARSTSTTRPTWPRSSASRSHTDELEPGSAPVAVRDAAPVQRRRVRRSRSRSTSRARWPGSWSSIEAAAGNLVKPDVAPPENLREPDRQPAQGLPGALDRRHASRRPTRA